MRFLIYEIYEDFWKIGLFFWWRHFRSRWRHHSPVFNGSQDLGLIFQQQNFWVDWTNQLLAEFLTRHPTFQISTLVQFENHYSSLILMMNKVLYVFEEEKYILCTLLCTLLTWGGAKNIFYMHPMGAKRLCIKHDVISLCTLYNDPLY